MVSPTDKKTHTNTTKEKPTPSSSTQAKNDYFELKIPKLPNFNSSLSPLWVILLLILSYLLGMQTAKLTYIEDKIEKDTALNTQTAQPNNPQQPILGEKVDIEAGTLPVLGDKNAKVTMIEFSDFQCPFCERFYVDTFPQLKKDYIDTGKIKFTFRHLPLDIHPLAPTAAEASECANDQDKFWEYHDELFNNFNTWTTLTTDTLQPQLTTYASSIGMNADEFSSCLTSGKYTEKVNKDKTDGQSAGATGTPSFFINGKLIVGAMPYTTFKTLLDEELK